MSNSPKQVDFALGLGDFILHLPDGQVTVSGEFFLAQVKLPCQNTYNKKRFLYRIRWKKRLKIVSLSSLDVSMAVNFNYIGTHFSFFTGFKNFGLIGDTLKFVHHFFHQAHQSICGLTPEAVIVLVANLESRELCRVEYKQRGIPFEHQEPRQQMMLKGLLPLCIRWLEKHLI